MQNSSERKKVSLLNPIKAVLRYLRFEGAGWKKQEILWLAVSLLTVTVVSIVLGDALLGIISAAAGISAAVLTGKGKPSGYLIGTLNSVLYLIIAFNAAYYGEVLLKLVIFIPLNIVGFVLWLRHLDTGKAEVVKRRLKNRTRIALLILLIPFVYLFGILLANLGDPEPFIDSFTTIFSVAALLLTVNRFAEQWWLWIVINIFSIVLWGINIAAGSTNYATLLMWVVYLINSCIMCRKWMRDSAP